MTREKPLILIADDVSSARMLYKTALVSDGYDIEETQNGKEALQFILEERPDLALLDINMPGLSGLEILKRLRTILDPTPLLIISANPPQNMDAYDCAFLQKPINIGQLRKEVSQSLDEGERELPDESNAQLPGTAPNPPTTLVPSQLASVQTVALNVPENSNYSVSHFILDMDSSVSASSRQARVEDLSQRPLGELKEIARKFTGNLSAQKAFSIYSKAFLAGDLQVQIFCAELFPEQLTTDQKDQLINEWSTSADYRVRLLVLEKAYQLRSPKSVVILAAAMTDQVREVGKRATEMVANLGLERVLPHVVTEYAKADMPMPAKILQTLTEGHEHKVTELLKDLLKGADTKLQQYIVDLMAERQWPGASEFFKEMLEDENHRVRQHTIDALSNIKTSFALRLILKKIKDQHPDVRNRAFSVLAEFPLTKETKFFLSLLSRKRNRNLLELAPQVLWDLEASPGGLAGLLQYLPEERAASTEDLLSFLKFTKVGSEELDADFAKIKKSWKEERKKLIQGVLKSYFSDSSKDRK